MAERPKSPIPSFGELLDRMNFLANPQMSRRDADPVGWIPAPDWRNDVLEIDNPMGHKRAPGDVELVPQSILPDSKIGYRAPENGPRQNEVQIPIDPAILQNQPPPRRRNNGGGAYIQYPGLQIHVERERNPSQPSETSPLSSLSQDTSSENGVPVVGPTLKAVLDVGQIARARRSNLRQRDGISPHRVFNADDGGQLSSDHGYAPRGPPSGGYTPYRPPLEPLPQAFGRLSSPPNLPQEFVPPASAYPVKPPLRGRAQQYEPRNGQTPALPPIFQNMLIKYIQKGKHDPKALQWYLDEMTAADARQGLGGYDDEDLEDILRSESKVNLSRRNAPGRWRPVRELGSGGYGAVVLWEREDEGKGKTLRVACKSGELDKFFQDYCHEGHIARKLISVGCTNVVKPLDWVVRPNAQNHEQVKIIMEFCPYGDLYNLIEWYQRRRLIFPELFIWHILLSVARALCYCARGTLEEEARDGWHPIYHRDLKPLNILLGEGSEPIMAYPTLKLADFGLSYSIPNDSVRQMKRHMYSGGTRGYTAPEAKVTIRSDPNQAFDAYAGPKSDIYSLGVMLMELLKMPKSHYPKGSAGWRLLDLGMDYAYDYYPYGDRLVKIARLCSRNNARERPEPLDLYKEAQNGFNDAWLKHLKEDEQTRLAPGETSMLGTVLYTPGVHQSWDTQPTFRQRFRVHNDWFYNHRAEMLKISAAVEKPLLAPPGYVSIGNGLGPTLRMDKLPNGWQAMRLVNSRDYDYVRKNNHHPLTNIYRDQLKILPLDSKWKKPSIKGTAAKKVQHDIDRLIFGTDLPNIMKTALRESQTARKLKRLALYQREQPLPSAEIVAHEIELEAEAAADLETFKALAVQNRKARGLPPSSESSTVTDGSTEKIGSGPARFFGRGRPDAPAAEDDAVLRGVPSAKADLAAALAATGLRNYNKRKHSAMDIDGELEDPRVSNYWVQRERKHERRLERDAAKEARGNGNENGDGVSSYERKRQKLQERRMEERESQKEKQRKEKKGRPMGGVWGRIKRLGDGL